MGKAFSYIKWILPVFFVLASLPFYFVLEGYSFSGLLCLIAAGISVLYLALSLLARHQLFAAKALRTVVSTFLILGILLVAGTAFAVCLEAEGSEDTDFNYMVVLGSRVRPDGLSVTLRSRIHAAYQYLSLHPEVICIVSGGQGSDEPMSEAQAMFDELVRLGIDPARIRMEDRSTSTWENLQFSLALIEAETGSRPEKLGLISSDYHLFRAGLQARDCGVTTVGIPAQTQNPFLKVNYILRETAGVWYYLLLGGNYND